jgi:hypothetical protein
VLTSGGGAASVNTWTTPTTGTVTSVGLTETGDALTITGSPVTSSGTINIAGAGTASQYINGALDLVTFPTVDNYNYWILSDGTNTTNITTTGTATFSGGTYITTSESAGALTITHDATTRTDTTSTDLPSFGSAFTSVKSIATNSTGHVTDVVTAYVTIPANPVMTAATASAAGVQGLVPGSAAGDQLKFLRADATWDTPPNTQGVTAVTATAPISSTGGNTPVISHDASGVTAGTYDSVTVDAKGHVTGGTNPGGDNAGMFSGSKSFTGGAAAATLFRLTRTTTGALIFDVYLTSATSGYSCKKYTVAHILNTGPTYNKIIDSGAATNGDYVVTFTNDGQGVGGDTVKCEIAATTTQDIHYTIQVGQGATAVTRYTS